MELPHLTLYLRRLAAPLPRGGGVKALLASPRVQWWGTLSCWLLLSIAYFCARKALGSLNWDSSVDLVVDIGINLALYLPLTAAMTALSLEPSVAQRKTSRRFEAPAWYTSLEPSARAISGVLFIALVTVAPTALGSMLILTLQHDFDHQAPFASASVIFSGAQTANDWPTFLWTNLGSLVRLPQLALAAGAMCLALRRSPIAPFVPVLMTVTAILAASSGDWWAGDIFGHAQPPLPPLATVATVAILLLLSAHWLLRTLSASVQFATGVVSAVLALCVLPGCLSVVSLTLGEPDIRGFVEQAATGLHAFYASYLPDLQPIEIGMTLMDQAGSVPAKYQELDEGDWHPMEASAVYGWKIPLLSGMTSAALCYIASLAFWFFTAAQCLDAARGRGRSTSSRAPASRAGPPTSQAD